MLPSRREERKYYLVRKSDGIPLAKGHTREYVARMGQVFARLGVPVMVMLRTRGRSSYWKTGESLATVRDREKAKRKNAA